MSGHCSLSRVKTMTTDEWKEEHAGHDVHAFEKYGPGYRIAGWKCRTCNATHTTEAGANPREHT